ncbi:hypothetical protein [Noviherbaspirillum denitrificans]|nr:hypothetical protein [Noviherbaspirillum denitrificans]
MISPLKGWQKVIAYGSLFFIVVCTAFGMGMIWLILTAPAL